MFQKLRVQFLIVFIGYSIVNLLVLMYFFKLEREKNIIDSIENKVNQIAILALQDSKNINDFFTYETRSNNYFSTQKSPNLSKHTTTIKALTNIALCLNKNPLSLNFDNNNRLDSILIYAGVLASQTNKMQSLLFERGYKDYGLEGSMREHAHNLEKTGSFNMVALLMLRRHEKDYIIRHEKKYIEKFNQLANNIIKGQTQSNKTSKINTNQLTELKNYQVCFNQLTILDQEIGIFNNTALRLDIDKSIGNILTNSNLLLNDIITYKKQTFNKIKILSLATIIVFIVVSLILSLKISSAITKRISLLSATISQFIQSGFNYNKPIPVKHKTDEVGLLIKNFETLQHKIIDQLAHLEIKVAERTEEINIQKEQIMQQNNKLLDSLKYAQRIQEAILPQQNIIKKTLTDSFIFYQPKDIVSGDFYWYKHITNNEFNLTVFAIADCTGHGVPGGFMSMLGIAMLNDVVLKKEVKTAADILNCLRDKIIDNLSDHANNKSINDGLDIALIIIDHTTNMLQFAGAFRDLLLIQHNKPIVFKGNRMPIGKYANKTEKFTNHNISITPNDIFYMFTDGFADQTGGINGHKYLRKKLVAFLTDISNKPIDEQHTIIKNEFKQWKGNHEQTDDILLAGIRFK